MIKLGIIGLSEGNGHPYSWSAIFNGYNQDYMKDCPFPVIPEYLFKQKFPEDAIKNAVVSHIYTQDVKVSTHVAKASNIENISTSIEDLLRNVDAVLLARDDADTHYDFAKPVIEAGLPIYIDKPIASNLKEANKILNLEKFPNQIFTCSAISYSNDFNLSDTDKRDLGNIKHIDACISKSWEKYSIHIIEPVLKLIGYKNKIINHTVLKNSDKVILCIEMENDLTTKFSTLGNLNSPVNIRLYGEKTYRDLYFSDTFNSFKSALEHFIDTIEGKRQVPSKDFVLKTVEIIEKGL